MSNKKSAKKIKKPAAPKAPKAPRIIKHDVVQPREGGKTRKIWDICARLRTELKRCPTRAEVLAQAGKLHANPNMAATQYGYWRRFEGITGRVSAPKVAKPAKVKKVKAPKAPKAPVAPKAPAAPKPPTPPASTAGK